MATYNPYNGLAASFPTNTNYPTYTPGAGSGLGTQAQGMLGGWRAGAAALDPYMNPWTPGTQGGVPPGGATPPTWTPWNPYTDPGYAQLNADLTAQGVSDAATLAAQRSRALIQFGEVPDLSGVSQALLGKTFQSDINPMTASLAQKNTAAGLSTVAGLNQHNTDLINQIQNNLAGRGLLQSGETGYQLGRENHDYTQAQYDARQKLVDYLSGVNAAYVAAENARQLLRDQALMGMQPPYGYNGWSGGTPGGTPSSQLPPPDGTPSPVTYTIQSGGSQFQWPGPIASAGGPQYAPLTGSTAAGTGYHIYQT